MNQDADPRPTGPSWLQVFVQFDDYTAAEHTGIAHLRPVMTDAEEAGLIASWWFVRKAPCWRLRYLPAHHGEQDTQAFLHQWLDALRATGRIAGWVETIYEPEVHEGYAKPSLKKCRPIAARNEDKKVFSGRL